MISRFAHKSTICAQGISGLEMAGDFWTPLGGRFFGAREKVHTSAAKCVLNFASQNYVALLNARAGLAQILRTDFRDGI